MSNDKKNALAIEDEQYGYSKDWHRQFPPMLYVSITNICNLKCIHCFHPKMTQLPDYEPTHMSMKLFEKICKEASPYPGTVLNFATDGEPMAHPEFLDMCRMARSYNIRPINLTTNGVLLTEKFTKPMIEENLVDIVNISVDAFTPETYKIIRQGNFQKLMDNIHNMIELRDRLQGALKIQVNIIDQPEAREELEKFKEYWEGRVDNVLYRTYYDATSQTGETGGNLTGKQVEFEKVERWPCQLLWRRLTIGEEGQIKFCVDDWKHKSTIGDLNTQTIGEVWVNEAYNQLRAHHIARNFSHPYCENCTEWQGMEWDYDYFVAIEKMMGEKLV